MDDKNLAIEKIVKMNHITCNRHLRIFVKVDINTKLKIFQHKKSIFHKLKDIYNDVDNTVLALSSLIIAIYEIVGELDNVNLNAMKLRTKFQKRKIKREQLLSYWAIVKTLKMEQNMSFRQIATYLKKYHKLEVAHSTVYALWYELEVKNTSIDKENQNG
ncbi:MAG: hypothetical protein U9N42_00880 [Campylobacterota bacterium]|nr:hypothetical protein [Campylobacterota bacterium]